MSTKDALTTEELVEKARKDPHSVSRDERAEVADQAVPGLKGKAREKWVEEGLTGQEQTKEAQKDNALRRASSRASSNGGASDELSKEQAGQLLRDFVADQGSADEGAPSAGQPFTQEGAVYFRVGPMVEWAKKVAKVDVKPGLLRKALAAIGVEGSLGFPHGGKLLGVSRVPKGKVKTLLNDAPAERDGKPRAIWSSDGKGGKPKTAKKSAAAKGKAKAASKNKARASAPKNKSASPRKPRGKAVTQRGGTKRGK